MEEDNTNGNASDNKDNGPDNKAIRMGAYDIMGEFFSIMCDIEKTYMKMEKGYTDITSNIERLRLLAMQIVRFRNRAHAAKKLGLPPGAEGYTDVDIKDTFRPDETYIKALHYCIRLGKVSVEMIHDRYSVTYIKACRIVDWMTSLGYISAPDESESSKILVNMDDFISKYGDVED